MKQTLAGVLIAVVLIGLGAFGAYFFLQKEPSTQIANKTEETQMPQKVLTPSPIASNIPSPIPDGWQTYTNDEYGFSISFPANYKALTDANNLYGWPNAVVLIYGGGQSYDLPIEVWDTESEYLAKYPNQSNLVVKKVGAKYITLMNVNLEAEVDEIISTFKTIQ